MSLKVPDEWERFRAKAPSSPRGASFGFFFVPLSSGTEAAIMVSDGDPSYGIAWEHVSVSMRGRCPTWDEMSEVKRALWSPMDWVVQYHAPESLHINVHPFCLHMWRPFGERLPTPPPETIA